MKNRVALAIVAVVLGAWALFPDPFPVLIDDIIAGVASAAAILKLVGSCLHKESEA